MASSSKQWTDELRETEFDVKELINEFENRLRKIEESVLVNVGRDKPYFPMLIVSLGTPAEEPCLFLQKKLERMWPQFRNELECLGMRQEPNNFSFVRLCPNKQPETVETSEISRTVSNLFDANGHFSTFDKLLIYYVLDTSDFQSDEDLKCWIDATKQFRDATHVNEQEIMELLILLLNEDNEHQEIGGQIRAFLVSADLETLPKILLISNRRSDNALDNKFVREAAGAVVAISNQSNFNLVDDFFGPGLLTLSYSRAVKPLSAISQQCVNLVLNYLDDLMPKVIHENLMKDEQIAERLGLSPEGTFHFLDDYIDDSLYDLIPNERRFDELRGLFPLAEPSISEYNLLCEETSARNINRMTFGAWDCYLENVVAKARVGVASSISGGIQNWRKAYREYLRKEFSLSELEYLSANIEQVSALMKPIRNPHEDISLQEDARNRLRFLLSGDHEIVNSLCDELQQLGNQVQSFRKAWKMLLNSRERLHLIEQEDQNFISYYGKHLRSYFYEDSAWIQENFQKVLSMNELRRVFLQILDRVFMPQNLGKIFADSFEDVGAIQIDQTRQKLFGADVHVYLRTGFALGAPIYSFILLKVDDSRQDTLYKNLKSNLPEYIQYYNTGSGRSAEALNIYRIRQDQIL